MKPLTLILVPLLLLSQLSHSTAQEQKYKVLIAQITGVQQLAKQSRFIQACKKQNAENLSLDEIKKRDKEWRYSKSDNIVKQSMSTSAVGAFLKNIISKNNDKYNEAFLTDAQGANIAAYPLTSDYWQGDEEKFTASFNTGQGQVFIGDIEFDESTQTNAVQVSVPVNYGEKTIGVLIIGVKVDHIVAEKLK